MTTFRDLDLDGPDLELLHSWVTHPRSHFWGLQGASVDDVRDAYAELLERPGHDVLIGSVEDRPAFLAELYEPATSEIGALPDVQAGDLGMHVLVAPPTTPVPGFTRHVFAEVMRRCFEDPVVERVAVEPDVRNDAIRRLNAEAGFLETREIDLDGPPAKRAVLSFCTRSAFADSPLGAAR